MLMSQAYCCLNPKTWCEKQNGSSWRMLKLKQAWKQPEISVKVIRIWNIKHDGVGLNFREYLPFQHVRPTSDQQLLVSNTKHINMTARRQTWSIVTSHLWLWMILLGVTKRAEPIPFMHWGPWKQQYRWFRPRGMLHVCGKQLTEYIKVWNTFQFSQLNPSGLWYISALPAILHLQKHKLF